MKAIDAIRIGSVWGDAEYPGEIVGSLADNAAKRAADRIVVTATIHGDRRASDRNEIEGRADTRR